MLNAIVVTMALAQTRPAFDLEKWNQERVTTSRVGMVVLGTWAVGNMAVGAIGFGLERDERIRSIHLGNLLWNTVNLGIAAIALIVQRDFDPKAFDAKDSLIGSQRMQTIFFINAALDAAYLATAAFLWQRGDATGDARFVGYGQSLLIQGAFLAVFDLTMALLNLRLTNRLTEQLSVTLMPGAVSATF
ncbi:MAG: hypothetical protein QM817_09085 [Archangium sp.]